MNEKEEVEVEGQRRRKLETVEDLERQVKEWADDSLALWELVKFMMKNERVRRMVEKNI